MNLAATDPTLVLFYGGATAVLLFAVAGGFCAGVAAAPLLQEWAIRRAASEIHRMYALVIAQIERAHRLGAELAAASTGSLSPAEWQRFEKVQEDFQQTFARLAQACGVTSDTDDSESATENSRPPKFQLTWLKEPVDVPTGLPNQDAYDLNLAAMLAQTSQTRLPSGLLLVRMDKADGLRRRLGKETVEKLLIKLGSVVVRCARDADLLCRVNSDTLALLCPNVPPLSGIKLSERIREHVRSSRFRLDEASAEVLVTASFGYANCGPGDSAELVRDRAADGLERSQSLGRNQLHVHDGEVRALCRA